ncbi:hypothetical protein KIPB_012314 [Kipferlia bialata]|uniref:RNB domain-containing protein n=1 Tax=Kipferlia bialata TaxID=797122 RepID=A0A9K3GPF6_9EUKA|nr:hypothetical protein KIPB_012314 [Kipferlia bialata]|eukprot:g12314.t1
MTVSEKSAEGFVHWGIGAPMYTHFTSPIRRYHDILVHRELMLALKLEKEQPFSPARPHRVRWTEPAPFYGMPPDEQVPSQKLMTAAFDHHGLKPEEVGNTQERFTKVPKSLRPRMPEGE